MGIIRTPFDPTVGLPQPVVLPSGRAAKVKMNNPQFYQQPTSFLGEQPAAQPSVQPYQPSGQQQQPQGPSSQEFIQNQLQKYSQRAAPPMLEPGTRVQSPNAELVQPTNFQTYYSRLSSITDMGQQQLAAAQARSAYQRMQSMQQSFAVPGTSGGLPVGYKNTGSGGDGFGRAGSGLNTGLPSNPQANFKFAQNIAGNFGWSSPAELNAWYQLGMKESGWRNTAQNPTSTAYGIGQFLDSTWRGYGIAKTSDPAQQVEAMARYIKARYGSPSKALAFHISHN